MYVALYPGSFDPWHQGHVNVLEQALKVFDRVVVCRLSNPNKDPSYPLPVQLYDKYGIDRVEVTGSKKLLRDYVKDVNPFCIIKGLRNGQDFEYEKMQQYWNEDLGVTIPTFYIISDRSLVHISSSAIRQVEKFK